jgi:hypothetical protein
VPLSLHNVNTPDSCAGSQSHFGTSTIVHVRRILANPNADIRNSLRRHRPNEARLATCALQGRHKTDSDDLTLSCSEKFLRMFLCRPGTLAPLCSLRSVCVPPFHPRLSSGRRSQRHPVCATHNQPRVQCQLHSHPRSCRLGSNFARCCDAMRCQGRPVVVVKKRMSACASNNPVDRRSKATARWRGARKSSRIICGPRGLASRLDSTRRRTLWVSCL